MELFCLGKPTIPTKEDHYIVRGHLTCGGIHKKPKFFADFYLEKSLMKGNQVPQNTFYDLFINSVRRFKKETDNEFLSRCSDKWGQHYIFYYYKDAYWCFDSPTWEYMEKVKMMSEGENQVFPNP